MADIDPQIKRRVAELIGAGCSQAEAAKAKGVGVTTVERWMRDPAFRSEVERAKASKGGGLVKDALEVLREAVKAETHDEEPNHLVRSKAAESILKHAPIIEQLEGLVEDDEGLRGAIYVYPGQGLTCPHCGKPYEDHADAVEE